MKNTENFNVTITCRHNDFSDNFKEAAKNDILKLSRYYSQIIDAYLIIDKQNSNYKVEISLHVPGTIITAKNEDYNHKKAVDSVIEKAKVQLKKLKSKIVEHRAPLPVAPEETEKDE